MGFLVAFERLHEILRNGHIFGRSIGGLPSTVPFGGFGLREPRGAHPARGRPRRYFLDVALRPEALESSRCEFLQIIFAIEGLLLPVDPAVAEGLVQGLFIPYRRDARFLLRDPYPKAVSL